MEILEFEGSDLRAENTIRGKLLKRAPTLPRADQRVIDRCSFLFLNRLNYIAVTLLLLANGLYPALGHSQQASTDLIQSQPRIRAAENPDKTCKIIYLGIVGGTETPNNSHSGVVQIRDTLQGPAFPDVCAKTISPYLWRSGLDHWILTRFPSRPGRLTSEDLQEAPKVILVGHSLGGWAALSIARNLKRKGIPVELCVQIDSVGLTDHTVPSNVKAAAIFHANDALFPLTTKTINLEDPSQSKLVENILVRDAGHWSVTRDPRIKDLVICTVESLRSAPVQTPSCLSQSGTKRLLFPNERPIAVP